MEKVVLPFVASIALIMGGMASMISPNVASLKPGDTLGDGFPLSVHFIGNVDGKSYFAENNITMNFTTAGGYCNGMGMSLATITSRNQSVVLANGFDTFFNGTFWTSGRDAHLLRQFSWDRNNTELNSLYVRLDEHRDGYLTCVAYHSANVTEGGTPHLDSASCSRQLGTLCET